MSHFARVKTKMAEQELLEAALGDLGFTVRRNTAVRGWLGQETKAAIVIESGSPGYDIGFVPQDGALTLVADWYGIHKLKQQQFIRTLTARYAYRATLRTLSAQGFVMAEETVDERGTVHLLMRRMG